MPFVTKCMHCETSFKASNKLIASDLRCPKCKKWNRIDESPEPVSVSSSAASSQTATDTDSRTPTLPVSLPPASDLPLTSLASPVSISPPTYSPPTGPDGVHLGGIAACLLAAFAFIASSFEATTFLVKPVGFLGLVAGLVSLFISPNAAPTRLAFPAVGSGLSVVLLAVAYLAPSWLGPWFEASRLESDYDPLEVRVVPLSVAGPRDSPLEVDGVADASRAALIQGNLRVEVVSVRVGRAPAASPKVRWTNARYTTVRLRLQHLGHGGRMEYVHWGLTRKDRTVPAAVLEADGRKIEQSADEIEAGVAGLHQGESLDVNRVVEDVLLFPPSASGPLGLELPGEAWGGTTTLRFHIPESMIESVD